MPPSRKCEIFVHYVFVQFGGKDRILSDQKYHHHSWMVLITLGHEGETWFWFLGKVENSEKKSRSISANCKQKRDLNLKKVLETSTQRDIRSVVSIGYFILDFYFFLPNCGSHFQIKSSSIDSSNINKRFQSWWVLGDTYSMKLSNFGFNWLYGFEKINLSTESAQTKSWWVLGGFWVSVLRIQHL